MNERDRKMVLKISERGKGFILFKCVFEDSDYHVDDMPEYKFDLNLISDINNMDELIKRLGQAAYAQCCVQEAQEKIDDSPVGKIDFKDVIDKELVISLGEAYSGNNHNPKSFIRYRKK